MRNMILIGTDGVRTIYTCPACRYSVAGYIEADRTRVCDANMEEYYSEEHARDNGWRKTKDIQFCPPDQKFVWVCPDCWPTVDQIIVDMCQL